MWLLENEEAFEGRRLWLRPGKTYLFGRTAAEPGQLAISHNTISRKHLTITVQSVAEGQTHNLSSRSHIKIEDLATKIGTVVNGQKIKGSVYDTQVEEYEITLGKSPSKFRLKWHPAVFTFSFTTKELQTQPLTSLKERFEQLDIKLLTDYSVKHTTHVISKKRNTAKGLQALINGKYIVTETFLDAVSSVTEPPDAEDGQESSYLERDFDEYWPKAMDHLPPRGSEPIQHPDELYTPNDSRKDVFEGYTFIFYSQLQYDNLMAPITNGGGKAMLHPIEPEETQVDDFVQYVKGVAGEKGTGSFNDGSEGKGVVLVRFLPAKGELVGWYTEFVTAVSLLLDHRPIEQNEFLEAILINDASKLRRPLEVESSNRTQNSRPAEASLQEPMTQQSRAGITESPLLTQSSQQGDSQPIPRRGPRVRKPVKRRFAGFDDDDDEGADEPPPPYEPPKRQTRPQEDEGGLFVSQEQDEPFMPDGHDVDVRSHRKRPPSPIPDSDLMEGMAPSVAKFKRQRLERGDDFAAPSPKPDENVVEPAETKGAKKKAKEELDVLAVVAKNREEAEARARAEAEDLANLPEGIDLAEIRRLNIVEEMDIRIPDRASGKDKEQEVANGRWNSKWNGMKNFKKFRKRGEVVGRQPARVIIALTEVKPKEFGVGDNYWLEDESNDRKKTTSQASAVVASEARTSPFVNAPPTRRGASSARVIASESSDMEEVEAPESEQPSSRATGSRREGTGAPSQKSTRQTQLSSTQTRSGRQGKRAATEPAAAKDPPPPKRTRLATTLLEVGDSDDSDDDLKFRFGKRR